jgi:hypothetical protein
MAASFRVSAMAALSPQGRVAQLIVQNWFVDWMTSEAAPSNRLGARQVALPCDPIVRFKGVPDLVLKFTILRSRQPLCDLAWSWCRCLQPSRPFGMEMHKLSDLEFVFGHGPD